MRRSKNSSFIGLLICSFVIAACSIITDNRTAEEWLQLVHAGMIAEDNYRFNGSVIMGFEGSKELSPLAFEGEILQHKQIAFHVQQSNSFVNSPVNELEFIVNNLAQAEIIRNELNETNNENVVVIRAEVKPEAATARWKDQLKQELRNISLQALSEVQRDKQRLERVQAEVERSEQELESMLERLEVTSQYEITIEPTRVVALHMNEQVHLKYVKEGSEVKEYRKSNITFDLTPN